MSRLRKRAKSFSNRPGGDQQEQRQRDLGHHQDVTGEAAPLSGTDGASGSAFQFLMQVGPRHLKRREDAEQHARGDGQRESEREHGPV